MRNQRSVWGASRFLFLALGLVGGFAPEARAGVTVDLLFTQINFQPIVPTSSTWARPAGDWIEMAVRFSSDQVLTGLGFSLHYDLDGDDALDPVQVTQWRGVAINDANTIRFRPIRPPSSGTQTFIGSFNSFVTAPVLNTGLPPGSYQIGTVLWNVKPGIARDWTTEILSGFFNTGVDGASDANFDDIGDQVVFRGATLFPLPEPGTAGLLGLGLLGLAWASGRRRAGLSSSALQRSRPGVEFSRTCATPTETS